jgi:hypothetical protein
MVLKAKGLQIPITQTFYPPDHEFNVVIRRSSDNLRFSTNDHMATNKTKGSSET